MSPYWTPGPPPPQCDNLDGFGTCDNPVAYSGQREDGEAWALCEECMELAIGEGQ